MGDNEFLDFMTKVYQNIASALKPGGAFYVWGPSFTQSAWFEYALY